MRLRARTCHPSSSKQAFYAALTEDGQYHVGVELRHLRYFIAVAEECHFRRAAERLHMAQPPLSQQIRQLEGELGTRLFARTTRKVNLTPAGVKFLERARQILADVDTAALDARRAERGEVGRLAVGFTGSATYEVLPAIAIAFRKQLPDVELELHGEMFTPTQVEAILSGTLDVGLLRPPVDCAELAVEVIRREPLVLVLSSEHRLAGCEAVRLGELRDEPFVAYASQLRPVAHAAVERACNRAGFTPSIIQETGETTTLVSLVAAGVGVSLVPASVQHLHVAGAVYRPLKGTTEEVALAVTSRMNDPNPIVQRFLGCVRALFGLRPLASGDAQP